MDKRGHARADPLLYPQFPQGIKKVSLFSSGAEQACWRAAGGDSGALLAGRLDQLETSEQEEKQCSTFGRG